MHRTEERPIVTGSPVTLGRRIGIEDKGRLLCGGDEKPICDDGSGVKYACLASSNVSSNKC